MTRSKQKSVGLIVFVIIYSVVLFWLISATLERPDQPLVSILVGLASIFWVALLALTVGLISGASGISLILLLPLALITIGRFHLGSLAAAGILALAIATAQARIKAESTSRIKYRPWLIYAAGVRLILLGLFVIAAGLSAPRLITEVSTNGIQVPEQTVALAVKPFESVLQGIIPGYSSDATVDDIIEAQLQEQLAALPPGTTVSPEQINQIRQQMAQQLNQEVTPNQPVAAVITAQLNQQLNTLTRSNPLAATLILLASIVLIIRIFIPLLAVPTLALISLLSFLLQQLRLAHLLQASETVERLEL